MSAIPPARLSESALTIIQKDVGGCREWLPEKGSNCWEPSEFVLWGKLIEPEGLGPRCGEHAAKHVGYNALAPNSGWALVNLRELARKVENDV